jgi:hypothetical protein
MALAVRIGSEIFQILNRKQQRTVNRALENGRVCMIR